MSLELLATIGDLEFERRKLLGQLQVAHARIAELEARLEQATPSNGAGVPALREGE